MGIPLKVRRLKSGADAQNVPTPITTYAILVMGVCYETADEHKTQLVDRRKQHGINSVFELCFFFTQAGFESAGNKKYHHKKTEKLI